jgi:poly(A) polymerase Pap1
MKMKCGDTECDVASWTKFFKRLRFFGKKFKHFIRIDIVANSVDGKKEKALEWLGLVESKLFLLLNSIAKNT